MSLTVESVTNPSSLSVDNTVLGEALKAKAESAQKSYVVFAGRVLDEIQKTRAYYAQRAAELQKQMDELRKAESKLARVSSSEVVSSAKGLFPVCAVLGLKSEAVQFAQDNGLIVPANNDKIWMLDSDSSES